MKNTTFQTCHLFFFNLKISLPPHSPGSIFYFISIVEKKNNIEIFYFWY